MKLYCWVPPGPRTEAPQRVLYKLYVPEGETKAGSKEGTEVLLILHSPGWMLVNNSIQRWRKVLFPNLSAHKNILSCNPQKDVLGANLG